MRKMSRRGGPLRPQEGQVTALAAVLLALVVVPLGLVLWGVIQQRADYAAISALVQAAADAGASAVPVLGGRAATPSIEAACRPAPDPATVAGRACQRLADGLRGRDVGAAARVDAAAALAATWVEVIPGSPSRPATDPVTGRTYHYPTVCVRADVTIGVFAHDGLGFVYHFRRCAQTAYRL